MSEWHLSFPKSLRPNDQATLSDHCYPDEANESFAHHSLHRNFRKVDRHRRGKTQHASIQGDSVVNSFCFHMLEKFKCHSSVDPFR